MAEYIEREAVLNILASKNAPWDGYQKVSELPAADVQPVKWIPVTERLPEETGHYLAYFVASNFEQVAWIEIVFFWKRFSWEHKFGEEYREKITHWMSLPEPPKDGEE